MGIPFLFDYNSNNCKDCNEKMADAKVLLEKKYKEEFNVWCMGKSFGTLTNDTYTVICSPKLRPEFKFKAEIDDEGGDLLDEYVSRNICRKIELQIQKAIDRRLEPCVVRVATGSSWVESDDYRMTIENFLALTPNVKFALYLIVLEKNIRELEAGDFYLSVTHFFDFLPKISGGMSIYIVDEDSGGEIKTYLENHAGVDSDFYQLTKDYKRIYTTFSKSRLTIGREQFIRTVTEL
jgi:hypothetical protein